MTWPLVLTGFLVFIATAGLGFLGLPVLRRWNIGQQARTNRLKTHVAKTGTPTIGGIFFIIPIVIGGIILSVLRPDSGILPVVLFALGLGIIGFIDDYFKIRINKTGLSELHKSLAILLVVGLFAVWYLYLSPITPFIIVPFTGELITLSGGWKLLYLFFLLFYFYAATNSVNLTDGVDGLCVSVTGIVALFTIAAGLALASAFAQDGLRPLFEGQSLLGAMLLGGCLGFFVHNRHVARMFMGDTGSLMLGAMGSAILMMQGIPWAFAVAGIIYVIEIGTVTIQRIYFRRTGGKRIFRMTPIHHHYELGGWSEWKIVGTFTLVTVIASVMAYLMLRV